MENAAIVSGTFAFAIVQRVVGFGLTQDAAKLSDSAQDRD